MLVPWELPEETHVSIIGPDLDERTNKVDVGVGFVLGSFARTEPTGPALPNSSFGCGTPIMTNVAEQLSPAVEVMSQGEWRAELDKIGSASRNCPSGAA